MVTGFWPRYNRSVITVGVGTGLEISLGIRKAEPAPVCMSPLELLQGGRQCQALVEPLGENITVIYGALLLKMTL